MAYIYGCVLLCVFPMATACAAYGVIKHMNQRRRRIKAQRDEKITGKKGDKIHVKEWLHPSARRCVRVIAFPD